MTAVLHTQPGHPQLRTCKNNCVFSYFFTPHFFFCDYTFSYCMKPSRMTLFMCLHIYSFPSSAFLKIQTSGFYYTSSIIPLLTFERAHFAVSLSSKCFSAKYWTGHRYFIHIKLELYCALASKKINTRLAFVHYRNGNEMDQTVRNDIACNCKPIVRIAFRYAHISF